MRRLGLGRFVIAVTAAVAALAAVSVVAAASTVLPRHGETPPPSSALPATTAAPSAAVVVDSQRLGALLTGRFPSDFGGLTITGPEITVYMTHVPRGLAGIVDRVVPAGTVLYARSAHTLGALYSIHRTLVADWMTLQDEGIDVVGFAPDVATSTEQVQVVGATDGQVTQIDALFPRGTISVQPVGLAPIPSGFTDRVQTEPHGAVPWVVGPLLLTLVALAIAGVALVLLRARRPQPAPVLLAVA